MLPSLSAIATATIDANISTAITINAAAAVSVFTDVGLYFCHYRNNCFCVCRSHHDRHFCQSCFCFLVDCCLTNCCHCPTDTIANAATNATTATPHPPKPPLMSCCCRFNRCHCAAAATFVFTY
jgi:hypothetical protein